MYAVFQMGTRQYRVLIGQIIYTERIHIDIGEQCKLDQVLFVKKKDSIYIGKPFIETGQITATILDHCLGRKIEIIKFRRRKHFRKFQGHRQYITKMKIVSINI